MGYSCLLISRGRSRMSQYNISAYESVAIHSLYSSSGRSVSQGLSLLALSLRRTVAACSLHFKVSSREQWMRSVSGATSPCLPDDTPFKSCDIYRIALFSAVLAVTSLIIGHTVCVVGTKKSYHLSSQVIDRRRRPGIVGDRNESLSWSLTQCKL